MVQAIAGVEALRALPPEAQLKAVSAMTEAADGYDAANAAYARWAQQNPNAAAVVGVAGNVAEQVISRGRKSVSSVDNFNRNRPSSFRRQTLKDAWDRAEDGTELNTKRCLTCGRDVRGNPYNKERRDGENGWDASHNPSWNNRDREFSNRKELLDEYNRGVNVECRHCNRSGQDNDERFK